MTLTPYRQTLALPGIKSLLVVATLARIPITAGAVTLTLHVVNDLGLGYGAAGLVGAAFTVGASLGAPLMGRFVDRRGLRPMLILTTIAEVVFWTTAQAVPYWLLLLIATLGGLLSLPAFSVARQSIAALAPEAQRLPAFALDSMTTELSFMAGPALGVLIATTAGPRVAMVAIGVGLLLAGIGLYLVDPPIRAADEAPVAAGDRVPRSSWLKPRLVAVLAVSMAATLVLSGTDVAVVAVLRQTGELSWTGLVLSLWAVYSLLGGFAYGMIKRGLAPVVLLAPMAALTIPIGLGGSHWWLLAILLVPAGALCAPAITASADAVSRLTPASARGEAMGLHNSALTVGVATGAPAAGLVMDIWSPAWGFAAVGALGVLVALAVMPAELRRRRSDASAPEPATSASATVTSATVTSATVTSATVIRQRSAMSTSAADPLAAGTAGPATEVRH
jgi:MFS family permease